MGQEETLVDGEVLHLKLDHLQQSVDEIKTDVRDLKDGAPLLRIQQLEEWHRNVNKFIIGVVIAVIATWAGLIATFVTGG